MTIKRNQAILLSLMIFILVLFLGIRTLTAKDEWICQNGKWIAQGIPSTPQPIVDCKMKQGENKNVSDEKFCLSDSDCACGAHRTKGTCFFGNRAFVDLQKQCPDFCSGVDGNLKISCQNNVCVQK